MDQQRIPLQRPAPASDVAPHDGATSGATESGWGRVLVVSLSRALMAMVVGLLVWSVLPLAVGWTPRAIMSGSMEPRIHVGDVVVGRPADPDQLVKDQVVTVTDPDHPVRTRTHRLLRRDAQGRLILKGDANPQADSTPVEPEAVLGLGVIRVPYVARPAYWWAERAFVPLGTTLALLVLVGLAAAAPLRLPRTGEAPPSDPSPGAGGPPEDDHGDGRHDRSTDGADGSGVGLEILGPRSLVSPSGKARTAVAPRRERRTLLSMVAQVTALVVSALLAVGGPAQAAYARTTVNGTNSWNAAADFRPYRSAVLADTPSLYWRLNETTGTTAADTGASARPGTYAGPYSRAQPGALVSESTDTAVSLTQAVITANTTAAGPTTFSVEAWMNTSSNTGGRLIGWGDGSGTTMSTAARVDRQLYLAPTGTVYFGIGTAKTVIASSASLNNSVWHHVVGTYTTGTGNMRLYVDGTLQGSATATTNGTANGYWRAGAEAMTGWTGNPDTYYDGLLDEVAVYATALTATRVKAHYDTGRTP